MQFSIGELLFALLGLGLVMCASTITSPEETALKIGTLGAVLVLLAMGRNWLRHRGGRPRLH